MLDKTNEESLSLLWDEYLTYKGIRLYPFKMRDYRLFDNLIKVLLFDKNSIPDPEIIKMSYLKFVFFVLPVLVNENEKPLCSNAREKLVQLLDYVLKEQVFEFDIDDNGNIFIYVATDKGVVVLREHDFDKIKNLIFIQNAIPIEDDNLHPDLKKEIQENLKYLAKKHGYIDGNIEDQVVAYKCEMKFDSYEPIKNMTIYQFRKELARLDLILDYKINKTAEMSGFVTFKQPIPHWRSHIDTKLDYKGLMINKKDFDQKMNQFIK